MAQAQLSNPSIGWIGVGKMGNPMATRLIEAGHALTICDPSPENRKSLTEMGAKVADTPADVAAGSDIVFSTIPNDAVLSALVRGTPMAAGLTQGARPGMIFVEMSTVSPNLSRQIATDLAASNIAYLRCPISGSTSLARSGKLTALASGDQAAWDRVAGLLDHLASRKFYLGPAEEARFMKLVLNTLVGATSSILAEALALGETGGLAATQMMEVINESAVASPLLKYKTDMIAAMNFAPAFSVNQMIKDFTLITQAAADGGVHMAVADLILQNYVSASKAGYDQKDFFALFDWVRKLNLMEEPA